MAPKKTSGEAAVAVEPPCLTVPGSARQWRDISTLSPYRDSGEITSRSHCPAQIFQRIFSYLHNYNTLLANLRGVRCTTQIFIYYLRSLRCSVVIITFSSSYHSWVVLQMEKNKDLRPKNRLSLRDFKKTHLLIRKKEHCN